MQCPDLEITLDLKQLSGCYVIYPGGGFSLCTVPPAEIITGVDDSSAIEAFRTPSGRTLLVGIYSDALPFNPLASQFLGREVHGIVVVESA